MEGLLLVLDKYSIQYCPCGCIRYLQYKWLDDVRDVNISCCYQNFGLIHQWLKAFVQAIKIS